MKKIYLMVGAIALTGMSLAQNYRKADPSAIYTKEVRPSDLERAQGDVVWEDDFSDPSKWTIGNEGVPQDWVIGTTGTAGNGSVINSTTAANGFAMFDSDGIGTDQDALAQDAWIEMAGPALNLTGATAVSLTFESFFVDYQAQIYVEFSLDGGTNYFASDRYEIHPNIGANESTDNPVVVNLNVSNVVANENNVRVRFRFVGDWDFYWLIDDIKMIETYENDLSLLNTDQEAPGMDSMDVYMVPNSQVSAFPGWNFGASIENKGSMDQANTGLNVTVVGQSYDETSALVTLNSGATDTFQVTNAFTTTTPGDYEIVLTSIMDNNDTITSNNLDTMNVTVGGDLYARDNSTITSTATNLISNGTNPIGYGNVFNYFADGSINGLDVYARLAVATNTALTAHVFKYDGNDWQWEASSNTFNLPTSAVGNAQWYTIPFDNPVNVTAGETVYVAVEHNGGTQQEEISMYYSQASTGLYGLLVNNAVEIYTGSSVIVRINETPGLAVNSQDALVANTSVFPNPANNEATINYTLTEAAKVSVEIVDVTGKVVYTNALGTVAAGTYNEVVNTADLSNGVYYYNFNVNGNVSTEKIVVSHK